MTNEKLEKEALKRNIDIRYSKNDIISWREAIIQDIIQYDTANITKVTLFVSIITMFVAITTLIFVIISVLS